MVGVSGLAVVKSGVQLRGGSVAKRCADVAANRAMLSFPMARVVVGVEVSWGRGGRCGWGTPDARISLALSRLRSRKCNLDTRSPHSHKATWPRLSKANSYLVHPRSNMPSSVPRGCASHGSVLGVMASVALARGGVPVGLGRSLAGGCGRVVMGDLGVRGQRRMVLGGIMVWAVWAGV